MVKPGILVLLVTSSSIAAAAAIDYALARPQPVQRDIYRYPRMPGPQPTQLSAPRRVAPRQGTDTDTNTGGAVSTPPADTSTAGSTPVSTAEETSHTSETSTKVEQTSSEQPATTSSTRATQPTSNTAGSTPVSSNTGANVVTNTDTVFVSASATGTNTAAASATSSAAASNSSSGLSTKSIIAMSVAGGLFLIGIAAFVWWKLSKKRFADFDDDDGAIKWPEFQNSTAMTAIGNKTTTDTDSRPESQQGFNVGHSQTGSISGPYHDNFSASNVGSTADLSRGPMDHATNDPYGQHPGQPYYDEPPQAGYNDGYTHYDPYSGPVPGTFDNQATPLASNFGGRQSPGPNMAYAGNERSMSPSPYGTGRQSPGPNAMYASGRTSPGPNMAYGGRTSPGPNMAYGGRSSPGPNMAYGARSASPGPGAAYGNTGRAPSPGPNMAYGGGRQSPGPNEAYHAPDMR